MLLCPIELTLQSRLIVFEVCDAEKVKVDKTIVVSGREEFFAEGLGFIHAIHSYEPHQQIGYTEVLTRAEFHGFARIVHRSLILPEEDGIVRKCVVSLPIVGVNLQPQLGVFRALFALPSHNVEVATRNVKPFGFGRAGSQRKGFFKILFCIRRLAEVGICRTQLGVGNSKIRIQGNRSFQYIARFHIFGMRAQVQPQLIRPQGFQRAGGRLLHRDIECL